MLKLKLKLQYFGHLTQRVNSLEKTLIMGKIKGRKRRRQQRMRWFDGITDLMDMSLSQIQGMEKNRETWPCSSPWGSRVGHGLMTEQQQPSTPRAWYKAA